METDSQIINYFWIGDELSNVELLSLKSCYKNGMLPYLWTYNKIKNVPSYVILKDADEIINKDVYLNYRDQYKLPLASISDIFRYNLLYKIGGIYSDLDIVFINNLNFNENEFVCSSYEYLYGHCANNCFIKLQKESEFAKRIIFELNDRISKYNPNTFNYCDFGPFLVQTVTKNKENVIAFDIINPINWRWTSKLIAYHKRDYNFLFKNWIRKIIKKNYIGYNITNNTVAVHLNNEIWKQDNLNKNAKYHPNCLFEVLKKKYEL